jgi:uncharacterized protein
MTAEQMIESLGLVPHPEGGWYRETWRSAASLSDGRAAATAILFLLEAGGRSHWHRVDAEEVWIHQAGAPLTLWTGFQGGPITETQLGVGGNAAPQHVVKPQEWQAAEASGAGWTLVACVVTPGFRFEGFELAPPGWSPI